MVPREEDGVHLQGQGEEERLPLPMHLGKGHAPPWQQRRRSRQVQVEPSPQIHGMFHTSLGLCLYIGFDKLMNQSKLLVVHLIVFYYKIYKWLRTELLHSSLNTN